VLGSTAPCICCHSFFLKEEICFFYFSLTFLLVNIIGFIGYYIYPAAPPWYVQHYGFIFHEHTPGNSGGLSRFDDICHISIFAALYSKSSNVFAAMPSLHAAYMFIVLYYGIRTKMGWANILFFMVMIGIWFSAVYNGHHYVLDVLAGIGCAITGIILFNLWAKNKARAEIAKLSYRVNHLRNYEHLCTNKQ